MKKLLSIFFLLFFSLASTAQEASLLWLKVYEGACSIMPCVSKQIDGGFILGIYATPSLGNVDSLCTVDMDRTIFMKYNADASIFEWSKCYAGDASDSSFIYMFLTKDSGYFLGGIGNGNTYKFLIHKENATGGILYSKSYGDSADAILRSMIATADGGYIMLGETNYTNVDFPIHYGSFMNADLAIIKVDSNGNKVWSKVIGGTGDEHGKCVVPTLDNGCYIIGTTPSDDYDCIGNHGDSSGSTDAYLVRLDANGNIVWHKDLGGTGYDQGNYGWPDGKGGVIVGATSGSNDGDVSHQINAGGYNIWAVDVDSSGNIVWNNCYGGGGNEFTNAICQAIDGTIWIAGTSASGKGGEVDTAYGNWDAYFVHADSMGNFLSAKVLGSHRQDEGYVIYPLSNDNIIAGGYYDTTGGSFPYISWSGGGTFLSLFSPWTNGIQQIPTGNFAQIYPNPASKKLTIKFYKAIASNCNIVISDITGRQVYSTILNGNGQSLNISINDWSAGIYYVQVISDNGYKEVKKLIIQ